MKPKLPKSILWILLLLLIQQLACYGQHTSHANDFQPENAVSCQYVAFKKILDSFYFEKLNQRKEVMLKRSNTKDFDLRFYIDTSYERRRTGGYNNNDSVIHYLNNIVTGVQTMFNLAAPNWDVIAKVEYVFFDGATPFSYGSNIAETLINFYDWLDAQGFPGTNDNYVFYSGNYTNQGVSFLGALCFPGGSLVGYISSVNPNEDLASHEWVGHCAGSGHYNNEVNIMNSIAQRPWNQPSIDVIESFLNTQSCVENAQAPLDISLSEFEVSKQQGYIELNWKCDCSVENIIIKRKRNQDAWESISSNQHIVSNNGQYTYADRNTKKGTYYYQLCLELDNGTNVKSSIRSVEIDENLIEIGPGGLMKNPNLITLGLYDYLGRCIKVIQSSEFDLKELNYSGPIIIHANSVNQLIYLAF